MRQIIHIDSARGDIGCDQNTELPCFEGVNYFCPLGLRQISMEASVSSSTSVFVLQKTMA